MENSGKVGSIFVSMPMSSILTEVAAIGDCPRRLSKLDFYIQLLETERSKVDAFRRELPYCMDMLEDAIQTLRKEMEKCREEMGRGGGESDERRGWMSSVQLWTTPVHYEPNLQDQGQESSGLNGCGIRNKDGETLLALKKSEEKKLRDDGLSLSFHLQVEPSLDLNVQEGSGSGSGDYSIKPRRQLSPPRKQRRCWSPELHRRFVEALQVLGGPQTATPKQIRELMQVEGLTNDEVKSHLQKYRLHIRKLPNPLAEPNGYSCLARDDPLKPTARARPGNSSSPQDHLHGGGSATGTIDSLEEDDDDRTDSWKAPLQRAMQYVNTTHGFAGS